MINGITFRLEQLRMTIIFLEKKEKGITKRCFFQKINDSMLGIFIALNVWIGSVLCPIHVVTFTLISNLTTDYIQKRRGESGLFSLEYNLSPNLISK